MIDDAKFRRVREAVILPLPQLQGPRTVVCDGPALIPLNKNSKLASPGSSPKATTVGSMLASEDPATLPRAVALVELSLVAT